MNPGNFHNMSAPRPQGNPPLGGMQRNGGASTDIRPHIYKILQEQQIPSGWQATLPVQSRIVVIHQMVTQLLIVKPDMGPIDAATVAASYELGEFQESPDKATYEAALRQKLSDIHQTRQNQANIQQQQLQTQTRSGGQMGQMGQVGQMAQIGQMSQMDQNGPAQLGPTQQQMLARRVAQGQMQHGFGMQQPPLHGQPIPTSMQQQPLQHKQMMQLGNGVEVQQPIHNGQSLRAMNRPTPQYRGQPQFTEQETQQINVLVMQMHQNLTPEALSNIERQISGLPLHQKQAMHAQGVYPLVAFLRSQAIRKFTEDRARRQQAGQLYAPPGSAAINNQGQSASQVSMRSQGQQPSSTSAPTQLEQSFALSNMDQFLGQQQDALRHQEAGQMVVPMSNPQVVPPQVRGTPNTQGQAQFNPNRPMQPNNFQPQNPPFWNAQHTRQQNPQQPAQVQMQHPTAHFPATQGQAPHLQGQIGGLNNNRGQRTPQQTHIMPTLNKPLDPQGQTRNNQSQRPAQSMPKTSQQAAAGLPQSVTANAPANSGQQRPQNASTPQHQFLAKLPPQFREQLMSMPEDKQRQLIMELHRRQQRLKATVDARSAISGQQGGAGSTQAGPNDHSNTNLNAPHVPANKMGSVNMQLQGSQQQMPTHAGRPAQAKLGAIQLSEFQTRQMDEANFRATLFDRTSDFGNLPDSMRTWGQLKEHVRRNESQLPQASLARVITLQSIDFQIRQQQAINQKRNQAQQPVQSNTGMASGGQMMPPQYNQSTQGAVAPKSNPIRLSALPEPTPQEIKAARANLPSQMKEWSDDQLRGFLVEQRRKNIMNHPQFQQAMAQHGQQQLHHGNLQRAQNAESYQNYSAMPTNQPSQVSQIQRGQTQLSVVGQTPMPPQQQARQNVPPKSAPGEWAVVQPGVSKSNQRSLKRSNDDVVEVPNPRLNQQQDRLPAAKASQQPLSMLTGIPRITQEQFAALPHEQKAQLSQRLQAAQRARATQANGQPFQGLIGANGANQGGRPTSRLDQLKSDVVESSPRRPEVPMSPNTRKQMIDRLRTSIGGMVKRLEQSLPFFLDRSRDENRTKELLHIHLVLIQQVRDSNFTMPVDNFTMSLAELEQSEARLHEYFQVIMKTFAGGMTPAQNNQPQQLNAANLQQQQEALKVQRAASVQKSHAHNSNRPPAAPTTSHVPFLFGSQSPQGVPHFYGPKNEVRDKLVLPTPKKKKGNAASPATTPAETQAFLATKPTLPTRTESPEAQRTQAAVSVMIKCPISDCESSAVGFATKEDLERHALEVHDPTYAIKDPFDAAAYAIESLRIALNLDDDGRSKAVATQEGKGDNAALQAAVMKSIASSQGVKQEIATPMSRVPTQTGPSPSSNLLKTPQAIPNVKTPASEVKSVDKDTATAGALKSAAVITPDPWANSHIKPEWFREVFGGVADLNRQVPTDIVTSWFQRHPSSPPTSPSSGSAEKDSPSKSDISANDDININVTATEDVDWVMADWFDDALQGNMADLEIPDFMDMDWEHVLGKVEDQDATASRAKRLGPNKPNDEWLRAWAPEKLEEQKKKERRRQ